MSFFMMPGAFQQQTPRYEYVTSQYPYTVNMTTPTNYSVPLRVERNIPFKVYVFERKFDKRTPLSSASNILRFEIDSNSGRSFELFDRVLREHSIDVKSCNLYYVDDEKDLVALLNERDFQFMIKLMKGQLTKIICEKKSVVPQQPTIRVSQIPQQSCFFGQCPQYPRKSEDNIESMIDKAFRSAFPIEETQQFFPKVNNPQPNQRKEAPRRIEIDLSELLFGIPRQNENVPKTEEKDQPKQDKATKLSFKEFVRQKMKERYPAEEKKEDSVKSQEEQLAQTPQTEKLQVVLTSTPEVENNTNEETPVVETPVEQAQEIEQIVPTEQSAQFEGNSVQTESSNHQELENQDPIIESVEDESNVIKTSIPHKYQKELKYLNDMGFTNHILNVTLLNRYSGNLERTISDLIHQ